MDGSGAADEEGVTVVPLSSDTGDGAEESVDEDADEGPPPKKFFNLPIIIALSDRVRGSQQFDDSPVNESSLTSPYAITSSTTIMPESVRRSVTFTTGSTAPRLVRFAIASVTSKTRIFRMLVGCSLFCQSLSVQKRRCEIHTVSPQLLCIQQSS